MSTITQVLQVAVRTLHPVSDSPRLDAELLLGKLLGRPRSGLIARGEETLAPESEHAYLELIAARRAGAPVAYLTGNREFWSLPLRVTPAVLVPRPETELLVELALQSPDFGCDSRRSVLDLGTGSGAIALALASERPRWRITAVDISPAALEVAAHNARALQLPQIDWRLGSWFEPVAGERFDLVVANPPYIADGDPALEQLNAEPALALAAGPTGFEALGEIAGAAARHLHDRGRLIVEHGSTQAQGVAALLERQGFTDIRSYQDFSGNPRITLGTLHPSHQETS